MGHLPYGLYKVRAMETGSGHDHRKWPKTLFGAEIMYKYLHTRLKFSNGVLVRVSINNYNNEQQIALFVILLAKPPSP